MSSADWNLVLAIFTAIATVVLAVMAALALSVARNQIKVARKSSANALFVDHLKLCLEYPQFAEADRPYDPDIRFENFMAITLTTYEEILDANPADKDWEETIEYNLKEDARFMSGLKENTDHFEGGYTPRLLKIVNNVIDEFRAKRELASNA